MIMMMIPLTRVMKVMIMLIMSHVEGDDDDDDDDDDDKDRVPSPLSAIQVRYLRRTVRQVRRGVRDDYKEAIGGE
jgi:hypothetical protein